MDEVRSILERLDRIETKRRANAGAGELLEELRALLHDAEEWSTVEGGEQAGAAVSNLRKALARDIIGR
ncbi:MAG: hypothetical protein U0R50_02060 [Gaiellales bacterium]